MTQPLQYRTVKQYGETEIIIQKSRFITYVNRVESEEEAANFVQEITRRHWNATHNCYAWVVGRNGEVQRYLRRRGAGRHRRPPDPGGDPRPKSGGYCRCRHPIFRGIKPGAGQLIRAYSQSASAGLDEAGVVIRQLHRAMEVTLDYSQMGNVERALRTAGYDTDPPRFTYKVRWTVWIPVGEEEKSFQRFAEITGGQGTVTEGAIDYRERED